MKIRSIVALAAALTIAGVHPAHAQGVKCADGTVAKDKAGCTAHGGLAKVVKTEAKANEKTVKTGAKATEKEIKTEAKAGEKAVKAEARAAEKNIEKTEKRAEEKAEKTEKTEKAEKAEKTEKAVKSEKTEKVEKTEAKGEKETPKLVEWKCKDGTIWRARSKKSACPGRHGGVKD